MSFLLGLHALPLCGHYVNWIVDELIDGHLIAVVVKVFIPCPS